MNHAGSVGHFRLGLLLIFALGAASGAEPVRFPQGKSGKGELKYVNGLPVLIVQGTPEEIGHVVRFLASEESNEALQAKLVLADRGLSEPLTYR